MQRSPTREPTVAILAPVPVEVLRELLESDDDPLPGMVVIEGSSGYNALADYQPGPPHGEEEKSIARALSLTCEGTCYVLSFDAEPPLETHFEGGIKGYDGPGDPEAIAAECGLANMLPAPCEVARSFLFVEGEHAIADVARALGVEVPGPDSRLHLELRPGGVLGWTEGRELGGLAYDVSKRLDARVNAIRDAKEAFQVLVYERGKQLGVFEHPPTIWSKGERVVPVFGYSTREEILRAVGISARSPEREAIPTP